MSRLVEYIMAHTVRGECQCGKCIDKGDRPDPEGHVVDVFFFKVGLKGEPTAERLRKLVQQHSVRPGWVYKEESNRVNLFDGEEHGYIELGGWLGSQSSALLLMGLGALLKLWELVTPDVLGDLPDALKQQMAGAGMITIRAEAVKVSGVVNLVGSEYNAFRHVVYRVPLLALDGYGALLVR